MRWIVIYETCALMWGLFNLLHPSEFGVRYRERLSDVWSKFGSAAKVAVVLWVVLCLQVWFLSLVWMMIPASWTPRLNRGFILFFRREILDRPGLLEPQMPAPKVSVAAWCVNNTCVAPDGALCDQPERTSFTRAIEECKRLNRWPLDPSPLPRCGKLAKVSATLHFTDGSTRENFYCEDCFPKPALPTKR